MRTLVEHGSFAPSGGPRSSALVTSGRSRFVLAEAPPEVLPQRLLGERCGGTEAPYEEERALLEALGWPV